MSRAFVKDSADAGVPALPDRPVSAARNLVTRRGLGLIEAACARHRGELAAAVAAEDREAVGRAGRELRYWSARLASAELVEPDPASDRVVFGAVVRLRRADGQFLAFRIVGEDEADPAAGRIAWTTPVARALVGAQPGDRRRLPTGEVEILALDATPAFPD
jgi:transcription elongation GreA/GreB family factor